jgi:tight adherence protein B
MSLPPLLLLVILAAAAAIVVTLVDFAPAAGRGVTKRARALSAGVPVRRLQAERALRGAAKGRFDDLIRRVTPRPAELRARLEGTGLPISFTQYGLASLTALVVTTGLAVALKAPPGLAVLEALASGLWLPHAGVGLLIARRRSRFYKHFPEAIGLIVRGLRAGLPVGETIGVVSREIADPVGEEFRRIADQVRLGAALDDAMWQTARRIGLPEFNFLVITLSVQKETGGNLAETLENLEHILRRRQQMRLKIKAMSSEATASALIIGALPFVMAVLMYLVNTEYMRVLFVAPLGRLMLAGGLVSLTVGALVMRKMVRFEI